MKKRSYPHFKCIKCNYVVSQREFHLEKYHEYEFNIRQLRALEYGSELDAFYSKWFIETNDPVSCKLSIKKPQKGVLYL